MKEKYVDPFTYFGLKKIFGENPSHQIEPN